ncbi:MAG TPA: hypothetical protein VEF07_06125, partial [Candidatus Binataceae bacterium]|nr:hypothetical protein [Candidatus Binataceae bacterium]
MRLQRGTRETAVNDPVRIAEEIADRMVLENAPGAAAVASFVITRAAQRAWEAINQQLSDARGALLWIDGPSGTGKTHFLNYVIALNQRAGTLDAELARNLTLAIRAEARAGNVEQLLLQGLAQELSGVRHKAGALWRRLSGRDAMAAALDQAHRQGVRTVTVAIDFGDAKIGAAEPGLEMLAGLATSLKHPKLAVIAAGRNPPSVATSTFTVGPEDGEVLTVAIGRARHLDESLRPAVDGAYRGLDLGGYDGHTIYPFHPASLSALRALNGAARAVAPLARLVREVLLPWHARRDFTRLIYPSDLMLSATARTNAESRLGESGRAALRLAYGAAGALDGPSSDTARQVVDTLMLQELCADAAPLGIEDLRARMPPLAAGGAHNAGPTIVEIIRAIAMRSRGAILLDSESCTVRFNPRAAGGPEVAAFNAALPLACRFDSTLAAAHELPELRAKLKRLGDAMASALEEAFRNRETLYAAARESGGRLSPDHHRHFADFIALAEGGPHALIECGANADRREAAMKTVADYEALALVAGFVPRLRAMREYLIATGLQADLSGDPGRDRRLAALETECQLLRVGVNLDVAIAAPGKFDALEARFQKFKWTYVQYYRLAHESWRLEMDQVGEIAKETHRHLEALWRLNSIAALAAPGSMELADRMAVLERGIVKCGLEAPLSPEVTPRCPSCGFVIGAPSPRAEIEDLLALVKRELQAKLALLSQSTIARLIRQHDSGHRLEGFLKITQAAQTDALVRVLDEELVGYLARLLDENLLVGADASAPARAVVQTFQPARFKRERGGHHQRPL